MTVKAGIYARISSDREADGLAIGRQRADCERLAQERGWRVVERYVDQDVSSASDPHPLRHERRQRLGDAGVGNRRGMADYT